MNKIQPNTYLTVLLALVLGLFGALSLGCATTTRGKAIQFGTVAKEVVDGGAKVTRKYLDEKAAECEPFVGEGYDALKVCLGKVASKPDEVDAAFEAVRSAQLGLYIALSDGSDPAAVKQATADLQKAVQDVVAIIQAIREEGK